MSKLLALICIIIPLNVFSQWVTIPDANFAAFLNQEYPTCMNGNQMDTTCTDIVNAFNLDCSFESISDLTGIQYFDSLKFLICTDNLLTVLPPLPATLINLHCSDNNLTPVGLSNLPSGLMSLFCFNNSLTSLPALPSSLYNLNCSNNLLTSLPPLPPGLNDLSCQSNQLTTLNISSSSLEYLHCSSNNITSISSLPSTLKHLLIDNNPLINIPTLPTGLLYLSCINSQINSLPSLPSSMTHLYCGNNSISALPALPANLEKLYCNNNLLTALPNLPSGLSDINCNNNLLTSIPTLPSGLTYLSCKSNSLTSLPPIPNDVEYLDCSYNNLTSTPFLSNPPFGWYIIDFSFNQLTDITNFPENISHIDINDNPNLSCIPWIYQISQLNFTNTNINCLPNPGQVNSSSPSISNFQLCDLFNTNGCDVLWNISGKVYSDTNSNCTYDFGELELNNLKINLYNSGVLEQQTYTGISGLYAFDTNLGTYTVSVDTTGFPVDVTCPVGGAQTAILTAIDSIQGNFDHAIECKPGFDIGVHSVINVGNIFPGGTPSINVVAGDISQLIGLACASGISGTVVVNFTGPISYSGPYFGALVPVFNTNTLTYTIPDFGAVDIDSDFRFEINVDTTATIGDTVCFEVIVNPLAGDNNISNNYYLHCFPVVNSLDPNEKQVFPLGVVSPDNEWLTYTVQFQNTGNAPAQHIYIVDTLDQNVDESSFRLLAYSHEPVIQIIGNRAIFNFPSINLPDSVSDEPGSHGYIQYEVRQKSGLPNGTIINNTAYIYFDFNPPIVTNTTMNTVDYNLVSLNEINSSDISIYPNPTNGMININGGFNQNDILKIYSPVGKLLRSFSINNKNEIQNLNISDLNSGIYFLKIENQNSEIKVGRIVKM